MSKISYVIPCYNSEKTIEKVIAEIDKTMQEPNLNSYEYEIILANDCSKDNVWAKIKEICTKRKDIKGISFAKNFGQHSALMAAYRYISGDMVISLDDDGQTPVNEVSKLISKIESGSDVVYATYKEKKHSVFRNLGTKMNNFMCVVMLKKPKDIMITSYFAARRFIIDEIVKYANPYAYVPGLVLRSTNSIATVPVTHRERMDGKSGYTLRKLLALWVNGFTAFSVVPLRVSMALGLLSAGGGFVYVIYSIINKVINPSVPMGWTTLISVTLILGGVILIVLGMIGEYIGRIYISINNSPQYVIKETINADKK